MENLEILEVASEEQSLFPQIIDQLDMERQYRKLMYVYEAAIEQITAKLNILKGEFQFSNDRNPIASISSRVKSKESIIYKMQKKGFPMSVSVLVHNIQDIAGVRVACPFIEDVWASTEHQLRYKKDKNYPEEMQRKLKRSADLMAEADQLMQEVLGDFKMEQW